MAMETVRQFLDQDHFDWATGQIILQPVEGSSSPGRSNGEQGVVIAFDHPILDAEFSSGYGSPQCPRYVARDKDAVYFPTQYDGSTCATKVVIDLAAYCQPDGGHIETPYPGG